MGLPSSKKRKIFDGRYEVIEIVGRGSDSVVYHAKHLSPSTQEVALKVLVNQKGGSSLTARLRKEALTLVSCRHKYVVRLDDFHSVDDLCYLAMEYAPYGDLRQYVESTGGVLSPAQANTFLHQVLEALDFVHATGVIHRDIKPDNILVVDEDHVRLADFGLALLPGDEVAPDELKNGVGSFAYLPPESLDGINYDVRSDLYALGLCFYELLTGSHPFTNASLAEQLERRKDNKITPLNEWDSDIAPGLSAVIERLLKFEPSERFQSAREALKALDDPTFTAASGDPANESDPFDIFDQFDDFDDDFFKDKDDEAEDEAGQPKAQPTSFEDDSDAPAAFQEPSEDFLRTAAEPFEEIAPEPEEPLALAANATHDVPLPPATNATAVVIEPKADRTPQPTEVLDADRIKAFIEQDAKQRAQAASRKGIAGDLSAVAQAVRDVEESELKETPEQAPGEAPPQGAQAYSLKQKKQSSKGGTAKPPVARPGLLQSVPPRLRPLAVGMVAAVVTVSAAALFQGILAGSDATEDAPIEDVGMVAEDQLAASNPSDPDHADAPAGPQFPRLASGMYAGFMENILPGSRIPLTLISREKQNQLVVIIGIPGWSPTVVSTEASDSTEPGSITVRSNGLILNVSSLNSRGTIEGTFSNTITGEQGKWQVMKVS